MTDESVTPSVTSAVLDFVRAELPDWSPRLPAADRWKEIRIAALGTVAQRMIESDAFANVIRSSGVHFTVGDPFDDDQELMQDPSWQLAVCFSPWKERLTEVLPCMTATARAIGAVDSIIRAGQVSLGINSTGWAARFVIESAWRRASLPPSILVLGTGASALSVGWAIRSLWGNTVALTFAARDAVSGASRVERFGAAVESPTDLGSAQRQPPAMIINATSWGETAESEVAEFAFPMAGIWRADTVFIDLNVRHSALAEAAGRAGAAVTSGVAMRQFNNAGRAALAALVASGAQPKSA